MHVPSAGGLCVKKGTKRRRDGRTVVGVDISFEVFEMEVLNEGACAFGIVRTWALILVIVAVSYYKKWFH